jgi:MFS family permease
MTTPPPRGLLRTILRTEVVAICLVAFLADIMSGVLSASFSLHAEDLGASVAFVGVLTAITGLVALALAIPVGVLSDALGRRRVLLGGMTLFTASLVVLAVAPSAAWLAPGRLLLGAGMVASFWIAAAWLGDVVSAAERGVAFGLFTTCMGLGFAVGPALGGWVTAMADTRAAYLTGAAAGVVGIGIILTVLRRGGEPHGLATGSTGLRVRRALQAGRSRVLLAVSIANVLTAIGFGGAVATMFPLHARELGITDAAIGTLFAVRALASTCVRLPSGAATTLLGSRAVLTAAIAIELVAVACLGATGSSGIFLLWLALEGIGYGAFLASSQAYIAEHTAPETRGAAMGFFSMVGGVGNTVAPLALSAVGAIFGIATVFPVAAVLMAIGLVGIRLMWRTIPGAMVVPAA